ncbi:MAG TPA: ATP-binding protein [Bacteroidales bacterium]|nr:ATP-binding protein [Bacteroidales bacterium]
MHHSIAIASGKGGTGKTTIAVGLYNVLSGKGKTGKKNEAIDVVLADCDVEEPNDKLFFDHLELKNAIEISKKVPVISKSNCTYCRKCVEYCEFNAIVVLPPAEYTAVNNDLCHSCGACLVACEYDAITEVDEHIGHVNTFADSNGKITLNEGRLKIGSTMQTMLIRETKKRVKQTDGLIIFDAPPGSSCPVVETIADTDYVILVAEPTPFGLHDMTLMVEILQEMEIPFGIVINKAGLGDKSIYEYIQKNKLTLLAEIPFSREFAQVYASGDMRKTPPIIQNTFNQVAEKIMNQF